MSTPPCGLYKVNVDGKTFQDHRPLSIGAIIRNSEDLVIATMSKTLPMQYFVEEVEAIALENGVLLAQEMNLTNIIVESNKHSFQNQTGPGGQTVKTRNRDENRFFKPKEPDFLLIS